MKALLQTGSCLSAGGHAQTGGWVPAPPEKRFLIHSMPDAELEDAFGLARERGVAIEITASFIPSAATPSFSIVEGSGREWY